MHVASLNQSLKQTVAHFNWSLYSSPSEQLAAIPEFKGLGPLFKSSEPVQLTEAETEYVVRCIKHTFANHMIFQFDCTNTLNDQLLQRVLVQMEPSEAYEVLNYVPAPSLPYSQPSSCYSLVRLPEDDPTAGLTGLIHIVISSFSSLGRFEQQIDVEFPIIIFVLFCCLHLS